MNLSEELGQLAALRERGVLSDDEFQRAKARVLGGTPAVDMPAVQAINALRRSRDDRCARSGCLHEYAFPVTSTACRRARHVRQYPPRLPRRRPGGGARGRHEPDGHA